MLSQIRIAPVRSATRFLSSRTRRASTTNNHTKITNTHRLCFRRHFHQTPPRALGILDDAKAFVSRLTLRAEASHILVKGTDSHSEHKIKEIQKLLLIDNNNDPAVKFAEAAARVSDCPSGQQQGGSLGSFGRYSMVSEFDEIVFHEDSKVGVVYGPVETNFGYHLILIHKRSDQ